jgi:isopentenyldiphosphate isomerase
MDELVDIVDRNGQPTGKTCLKSEAHKHGWLHPTIHVWFYTDGGQILLQLRKEDKETFPNLWDVSVAGHIASAETALHSAIREINEEIGITVTTQKLTKIGSHISKHQHPNGIIDYEYHHVFLCKLNQPLHKLTPQEEEVSKLQLISISTFRKEINNTLISKKYVPHTLAYYNLVLQKIEEQLKK